jgi:hypothetical protein
MSNIIFRVGNGEPLTHEELDNNFRYLHDWQPDVAYFKDQYVEYESSGSVNLYKAKYDIPGVPFFNPQDWKKFGDVSGGLSGEVIDDVFVYDTGVTESPFTLSQTLSQLIAVEINGDDRVDTDDFYYDENTNQIFYTSALYDLQDTDVIVVKYTTSDSNVGGGSVNEDIKPIRTISPAEASTALVLDSDVYLSILSDNITSSITLQLPETPEVGHEIKFMDASGNVGSNGYTYNITADVADNIEGNSSITLNSNYGVRTVVYLGNNLWKVL